MGLGLFWLCHVLSTYGPLLLGGRKSMGSSSGVPAVNGKKAVTIGFTCQGPDDTISKEEFTQPPAHTLSQAEACGSKKGSERFEPLKQQDPDSMSALNRQP